MSTVNSKPTAEDALKRMLIMERVRAYGMFYFVLQNMIQGPEYDGMGSAPDVYEVFDRKLAEFSLEIQQDPLWPDFSSDERAFIQTNRDTFTEHQILDASWAIECIQVLAWALGYFSTILPYDEQADPEKFEKLRTAKLRSKVKSASLRPEDEIETAREQAEFWHWRSRTRQLIEEGRPFEHRPEFDQMGVHSWDDIVRFTIKKGADMPLPFQPIDEDFPAFGKAYRDLTDEEWSSVRSITMERHKALNWLCGRAPENDWDRTPTDPKRAKVAD